MAKQVRNKKSDKNKKKKYTKSDYILLGLFIFLLLLCVVLSVVALVSRDRYESNESLMIIPVTKDNLKTSLDINLDGKKSGDVIKYRFRVNNYYNSIDSGKAKINNININYSVFINNNIDAGLKLMKDGKEVKLTDFKTESFELKKNKRQEDNYELVITFNTDVSDDNFVNLIVEGQE